MVEPTVNNNDIKKIKKDFIKYLKEEYPFDKAWIHPISYEVWSCEQVKDALFRVKRLTPENYRIFLTIWTGAGTSEQLADRFHYSATVIKKKWEKAVGITLTLLKYPELDDEQVIYLGGAR